MGMRFVNKDETYINDKEHPKVVDTPVVAYTPSQTTLRESLKTLTKENQAEIDRQYEESIKNGIEKWDTMNSNNGIIGSPLSRELKEKFIADMEKEKAFKKAVLSTQLAFQFAQMEDNMAQQAQAGNAQNASIYANALANKESKAQVELQRKTMADAMATQMEKVSYEHKASVAKRDAAMKAAIKDNINNPQANQDARNRWNEIQNLEKAITQSRQALNQGDPLSKATIPDEIAKMEKQLGKAKEEILKLFDGKAPGELEPTKTENKLSTPEQKQPKSESQNAPSAGGGGGGGTPPPTNPTTPANTNNALPESNTLQTIKQTMKKVGESDTSGMKNVAGTDTIAPLSRSDFPNITGSVGTHVKIVNSGY